MGSKLLITPVGFSTSIDIVQNEKYSSETSTRAGQASCLKPSFGATSGHQTLGSNSTIATSGFKRPRIESLSENTQQLKASPISKCTPEVEALTNVSEYTQRRALASTPRISQNALLSLSHHAYGLPETLVGNFNTLGINSIYPWQSSCLLGRGLLTGEKNLVYTAPTGGGKSLVADVLMLKRVIENRKAVLVLPYVALVQEKLKWLRRAVEGVEKQSLVASQSFSNPPPSWRRNQHHCSIRVVGLFGGSKTQATWADIDIAVCTIEKVQ